MELGAAIIIEWHIRESMREYMHSSSHVVPWVGGCHIAGNLVYLKPAKLWTKKDKEQIFKCMNSALEISISIFLYYFQEVA